MPAFHPATVRLLERDLADTTRQHKRDLGRAAKLPNNSKSKMAMALRERIADAMGVIRDLERLLDFTTVAAEAHTELVAETEAAR